MYFRSDAECFELSTPEQEAVDRPRFVDVADLSFFHDLMQKRAEIREVELRVQDPLTGSIAVAHHPDDLEDLQYLEEMIRYHGVVMADVSRLHFFREWYEE